MEITIGHSTDFWKGGPFAVNGDKHAALIAESGTGKSVLLGDMAIQDIRAGRPVVLIDPHDELADRVLSYIPKNRLDDVRVFDPLSARPIGLPVLRGETREELIKRADQFIDTASKIYGEHSWGGQSAYIARNLLYAIIEVEERPNPAMLFRALMSKDYRAWLFGRVRSKSLEWFSQKFDEDWRDAQREQAAAAPTNKADTFISNWIIRDTVCQDDGLDFFDVFQNKRIVICRLGKGRLGPETSAFLGSLVMQECFFAGLARERVKPAERGMAKIYVDEFHNFVKNDAAEFILAELRKYGVALVAADQNAEELPRENFLTRIVGRVDARSAEILAAEFGKQELAEALTKVPNFHWWAQTVRPEGYKSDAKLIRGLPPLKRAGTEYPAWRVIRHSEANHGRERKKVEAEVNQLLAA